jgi:hypothetical protein
MAIRDHFRVDVLVCGAAELPAVTVELAEIERPMRLGGASLGTPVLRRLAPGPSSRT